MAFAKTSSAIRPPKNPLAPVQRAIHRFPGFTPDRRGKTTEHKDRPDILRDRAALDSPLRHCRLILETRQKLEHEKQVKREVWLQVTAGQGPSECAWAVVKVLERIQQEAELASLEFRTIEIEPGPEAGTAQSALVAISGGTELESFANSWRGTVQWTERR